MYACHALGGLVWQAKKSEPAAVKPGERKDVRYSYCVENQSPLLVRGIEANAFYAGTWADYKGEKPYTLVLGTSAFKLNQTRSEFTIYTHTHTHTACTMHKHASHRSPS